MKEKQPSPDTVLTDYPYCVKDMPITPPGSLPAGKESHRLSEEGPPGLIARALQHREAGRGPAPTPSPKST